MTEDPKRRPHAPRQSPEPANLEPPGEDTITAKFETPLSIYLRVGGISQSAFARAMGVGQKSVADWSQGSAFPSLTAAYEMERISKGVIPMEAWMGHPQARSQVARWRTEQPGFEDPPVVPAGGYASPTKNIKDGQGPTKPLENDFSQTKPKPAVSTDMYHSQLEFDAVKALKTKISRTMRVEDLTKLKDQIKKVPTSVQADVRQFYLKQMDRLMGDER